MNELLKYILINSGKSLGIFLGFTIGLMIVLLGFLQALFIAALVVLGFILGKWHDEGVSVRRLLKKMIDTVKENRWRE
ncbi:MAG TPA: DUF2273 domain-containing protein [bacterium]|nr:DUF2273 domain-containing protein [bacterium]